MDEQGKVVEDIMYVMMNVLEDVRREIKIEMEKLKVEIRCKEKDWIEERNRLKERIKKLEVKCEGCNKIKNNRIGQLKEGGEEMDSKTEDMGRDRRMEVMKGIV
ncbi:hypothetical protein ALC62_14294 [Cyphomyrmex costatus]|uniref:Uncharacterized protein n=1 Tax=Cyphomyrmex costatus TaxID=456900 RepID=A0A151I8V4_9HYME|nr:hypothetical protein ALC62_14294 [Cyphomyrmex costatus]